MENIGLLGIDLGQKRVGVALSHGFMAEGLTTLDYSDKNLFYKKIKEIIIEQKIGKIIVGLPVHNGQETKQTVWTRQEVESLRDETGLPIELVDEAYSSVEADKFNADRDSESARIILEQYLEQTK